MENYSNYSYPDSRDSSPRSREIDSENPSSWDELPSNYKVKFMCSYGGKIQPRSHDNQLAYIGGDTKILAVDRNIKLSAFISKLSSLCGDADVCFKYQLPGEDLDALISVTNDEDLEHMMLEYDRLYRASAKPARLRLFLFPPQAPTSFGSDETKSERQWFVDALNSVQIQSLEDSSPPAVSVASAPNNPDFLFGFDKGYSAVPGGKFPDTVPPSTVPDSVTKDVSAGSDCGSEDRHLVGAEPVMSPTEIQRQIQDLQRMQIAGGHEQNLFHRKYDEVGNPRAYAGDYYSQNYPEKLAPNPSPVQMPVQVPVPATYLPERHMAAGGYSVSGAPTGTEQQFYFIPTPTGVYQAPASLRPATGPISQAYYGVQRVAPEVYREAHMFNPAMVTQQPNVGNYMEGIQMPAQQTKIEVAYDSTGRQQLYYTTQGGTVSSYQTVTPVPVDGRQGSGGTLNQDGKVVGKASQ